MKKSIIGMLAAGWVALGLAVPEADAAFISGYGQPSSIEQLNGGLVTDFENMAAGTYSDALVGAGVTFTTDSGKNMHVGSAYAQERNTTGKQSLYNIDNSSGFSTLFMKFDAPATAFAFNFGASNISWTLSAYDIGGALLESYALPVILTNNNGEFYGISNSAGIASARLTGSSSDWILIDRVTAKITAPTIPTAVPAPAALALLGGGLLGLTALRRRRA